MSDIKEWRDVIDKLELDTSKNWDGFILNVVFYWATGS